LFLTGRTSGARREFAKAVQLCPADDYAHFALALACERTGQPTRARAHAKLALALRPGVDDYERVLARLTA
jgi:Flp pilus assembly protein TadD